MSSASHPPFYINAIEIKWEHNDTLHVDHFFGFLSCHRMPDVPGARIRIIDFCFSWTQPKPSYNCFVTPMPKVVIPSESHSLFFDVMMSSTGSNSSSKDTNAISPLMSPRSLLPKSWVPLGVDVVDLVSVDEG